MNKPNPVPDETLHLQALNALKVLDTPQEERFDRITKLTQRVLDAPIVLFSLVDENRVWFQSRCGFEAAEIRRTGSLFEHALLSESVFVVEDATEDERFRDLPVVTGEPGIRFYAGCPVSASDGSRLGTLSILDTVPRQLAPDDIELMHDLGHMVENELSTLTMATTDELTRLANRRGFRMIAEPMIALCHRAWHSATLVMFDMDGLKQINDEFGHEAGDLAIKDFARLLLKAFRDSDVVARLGGDEFCVLLTGPQETDPAVPLKRLEQRIESHSTEIERQFELTFSAGAIPFDKKRHASIDDLLRDADRSMYVQKRSKKCPD